MPQQLPVRFWVRIGRVALLIDRTGSGQGMDPAYLPGYIRAWLPDAVRLGAYTGEAEQEDGEPGFWGKVADWLKQMGGQVLIAAGTEIVADPRYRGEQPVVIPAPWQRDREWYEEVPAWVWVAGGGLVLLALAAGRRSAR